MAGKLKGFDAKKVFIQHGEKIAFGVVVVLVLVALIFTNWTPYDHNPEDITNKVASAKAKLAELPWPEDKREEFVLDESEQPERVVGRGLNDRILVTPDYYTSQPMYTDMVSRDNPLQEPDYVRVLDMVATTARVLIELRSQPEVLVDDESGEAVESTETAVVEVERPDEFRERGNRPGAQGPAGLGLTAGPDFRSMLAPELAGLEDGAMMDPSMMGYGMDGQMGSAQQVDGEAHPFVSVRGVFEFKEQVRKFAEAMHANYPDALQQFEIIDFELERQQLLAAPDTWSDWRTVDVNVFRDIVSRAAGLDADIVSAAVTDSAITCPLPLRITGVWDKQATHDRLEAFELSGDKLQYEVDYNRALLTTFLKQQKDLPDAPVEKKGFSDMVFDSRQLQQGYMGLESSYDMAMMMEEEAAFGDMRGMGRNQPSMTVDKALEEFAKDVIQEMDLDDPEAQKELTEFVKNRAKAEGELLLFRYLDFDVEPGRTYRYRVRLEIRNPNFGKNLAAAGGLPHVVLGETRMTDWSDATNPIRVEETVKYFLTSVEEARRRLYPEAKMNIFQYDRESGTTVQDELEVAMGQNIGGETDVEWADPTKGTFEEKEDYPFKSDDLLVDALPDLKFDPKLHEGLRLPAASGSRGDAGMTEFVLVVTSIHELRMLDPDSLADALAQEQQLMTWQDDYFAYLKDRSPAAGEATEGYEDIYGLMAGEMEVGDAPGGRRRNRNSLRRGSGMMPGGPGSMRRGQ